MGENIKIPPQLKPTIDKFYDDLSAVLTDYENHDIDTEDLYDFMVALQMELCNIIYND